MTGTKSPQCRLTTVPVALIIAILVCLVGFEGAAEAASARPDIIMIDMRPVPGGEKMPAVQFLHDLHTEALAGEKGCSACHPQNDNTYNFKFKRSQDGDPETDMTIYHDNCVGCHQDSLDSGKGGGPLSGDCRSCHNRKPTATSARQPVPFDKSLHYRHASSSFMVTDSGAENTTCEACHHKYDQELQKTVYVKGKEETCRYCHHPTQTKDVRSLRAASHVACINCHQQKIDASQKAGPVNCGGCHDSTEQKKIKIVKEVPRLKRNQPDAVLMASWMKRPDPDAASVDNQLGAVAFNHQTHETKTPKCTTCHHQSLERCSQCHTETGHKKGGFVRLESAMHAPQTEKSCRGCHRRAQKSPKCAGCHGSIPARKFADMACNNCHTVGQTGSGVLAMSELEQADLARETLNAASLKPIIPSDEQIPETVTIKSMVDKYEAATFPHRRIIRKLAAGMREDRMARFFHTEPTTMCMGCHHNSPASARPPKCAACHGESYIAGIAGRNERPGLKGAYHGQCIACHQIMKIVEPKANNCTGCHKKRN